MTKKTDYKRTPEPHYYVGKKYGYSARAIVDDFQLSAWTAQAAQYILRAGKKEGSSAQQDIQKAINVLHFELDRLYVEKDINTGALAE
tara:strand:+ start:123 stop:386 length:264 start_codon:yes stop_codon:yes gene_type:complete